jgi:hypothetical protein
MQKAWRFAQVGDIIVIVVPENPESYGFTFGSEADALPDTDRKDWSGCCC